MWSATRLENLKRGGDLFGDTPLPKHFKASEAKGSRASVRRLERSRK
jgi:hypothetical protein